MYSLSARDKPALYHISDFLTKFNVDIKDIDYIFGFVEKTQMYGGRAFYYPELSNNDLKWMRENNIGYKIPLQNMFITKDTYKRSFDFLSKYHNADNAIVLYNDSIASLIRKDFPNYKLEASVIKNINTIDKIKKACELYDTIVPDPKWLNENIDVIPENLRNKIRVFLAVRCLYDCTSRICYPSVSRFNINNSAPLRCSKMIMQNFPTKVFTYRFNVNDYLVRGYSKFKMISRLGG